MIAVLINLLYKHAIVFIKTRIETTQVLWTVNVDVSFHVRPTSIEVIRPSLWVRTGLTTSKYIDANF